MPTNNTTLPTKMKCMNCDWPGENRYNPDYFMEAAKDHETYVPGHIVVVNYPAGEQVKGPADVKPRLEMGGYHGPITPGTVLLFCGKEVTTCVCHGDGYVRFVPAVDVDGLIVEMATEVEFRRRCKAVENLPEAGQAYFYKGLLTVRRVTGHAAAGDVFFSPIGSSDFRAHATRIDVCGVDPAIPGSDQTVVERWKCEWRCATGCGAVITEETIRRRKDVLIGLWKCACGGELESIPAGRKC